MSEIPPPTVPRPAAAGRRIVYTAATPSARWRIRRPAERRSYDL